MILQATARGITESGPASVGRQIPVDISIFGYRPCAASGNLSSSRVPDEAESGERRVRSDHNSGWRRIWEMGRKTIIGCGEVEEAVHSADSCIVNTGAAG